MINMHNIKIQLRKVLLFIVISVSIYSALTHPDSLINLAIFLLITAVLFNLISKYNMYKCFAKRRSLDLLEMYDNYNCRAKYDYLSYNMIMEMLSGKLGVSPGKVRLDDELLWLDECHDLYENFYDEVYVWTKAKYPSITLEEFENLVTVDNLIELCYSKNVQ